MTTLLARWVIEAKVLASTVAAAAAGGGAAILNGVEADHTLLGSTPAWAQTLLLVVIPTLVTFLAGYKAKHTPRPDLGAPAVAVVPPATGPAAGGTISGA